MWFVLRCSLAAVAAAVLALAGAAPRPASAAPPAFTRFAFSTGSLPLIGGWVTVTGSAAGAMACSLADVAGRPVPPFRPFAREVAVRTVSAACSRFQFDVHFPASAERRVFRLSVVALGLGRRSRGLRVVQEDVVRRADPAALARTTFVTGDGSSAPDLPCSSHTALDTNPLVVPKQPIEPLGHINDDHVLPDQADHVYLWLPGSNLGSNRVSRVAATRVVSPGRVRLLEIVRHRQQDGTGYELDFSPCRSLMFWFDHVVRLAPGILPARPPDSCSSDHSICAWTHLSVQLYGGQPVGWTGGVEHLLQLDFGAADVQTPPLAFIDQNRTVLTGATDDSFSHTVCPLAYFTPTLEGVLFDALQGPHVAANGVPPCGATMQDRPGTLQGNWYRLDSPDTVPGGRFDSASALAIVHYNVDPRLGVVGMGKRLIPGSDSGDFFTFAPQPSGSHDPEPRQVHPGRRTICYDGVRNRLGGQDVNAHVLLQLVDATTLEVAYGAGPCGPGLRLTHAAIYVR